MTHPLFSDAVTVYHRDGDQYVKQTLSGVQWRQKIERLNDAGKLVLSRVTSVTIPDSVDGEIAPGDVLILGEGPELSSEYTVARLRADCRTYCTVQAVTDNRLRPQLKHRKVLAK